jgi:hypothetical protein
MRGRLPQSEVPPDLIEAYRSAYYQAGFGPGAVILHVDQYSEPLSQLFNASGHRCATFITGCNPFGIRQDPQSNRAAYRRLRDRLVEYVSRPDQIIEGAGSDPTGCWPAEESFLVLGLGLEASRMLGGEFYQNAIVWAGEDAIPRLILLR